MTGTDLVVQSTAYSRFALTERQQYVALLATAGSLLPSHLKDGQNGNPGKTFLLCETGDMLGIHPIAAMTGVHIIDGKPSISANLMSGLVRSAGHILRVKVTGRFEDKSLVATAQLIRKDDPDFTFEAEWTVADAERAGLWGKGNWLKYPRAMIKSRVISEISREGASEVLMGGNVYTPEELGAAVDENGEPVDLPQVQTGPMPEAPITEDVSQGGTDPRVQEYLDKIANAATSQEALAIYQSGRTSGVYTTLVTPIEGEGEIELGQYIINVGVALRAAEEQVTEGVVEPDGTDDTPAVLDPNVEDAVVVDDAEVAEAAAIAAHEAEEATKAKPARASRAKTSAPTFEADGRA